MSNPLKGHTEQQDSGHGTKYEQLDGELADVLNSYREQAKPLSLDFVVVLLHKAGLKKSAEALSIYKSEFEYANSVREYYRRESMRMAVNAVFPEPGVLDDMLSKAKKG